MNKVAVVKRRQLIARLNLSGSGKEYVTEEWVTPTSQNFTLVYMNYIRFCFIEIDAVLPKL